MDRSEKHTKTMADIARLAGVSASTVSRALDNSPLISNATKEHVKKIARQNAYRPHLGARNLRLQKSSSIALVIPLDFSNAEILANPFFLKFSGVLAAALRDHGYDMLVSQMNSAGSQIDDRYIHSGLADGAILLGRGKSVSGKTDPLLTNLVASGVPFVVWGPAFKNQSYCSVGIDNVSSANQAVKHLAKLGRRRIAIITDNLEDEFTESHLRYQGYCQALAQLGLPLDIKLVGHASSAAKSGYAAALQILQSAPNLDAIFAAHSDVAAISAMQALRQANLRIPEDVAVVGFDNIEIGEYTTPPLTSVSQRIQDGGAQLLVQKLLQLIDGQEAEPVMLEGKLIVRQSCGAIPSKLN